jgi:hypothetical protein
LVYIKLNIFTLAIVNDKLQAKNLSVTSLLNFIENIAETFEILNDKISTAINLKLKNVLEKK